MKENQQDVFTRRMFIKGMATSFGALPVFAWPRWAQAFYYNLGFFKKGSAASLYVEDVFSTYLYTGAASTGTLPFVNGIDLTQGGLVWLKERSNIGFGHYFFDTARGTGGKYLTSSATAAEATDADTLSGFNNNGWTIGRAGLSNSTGINSTGATYASWTFRKAAKFFDVVTYTGDGTSTKQVSHSLGTIPGFVIIKRTDNLGNWIVLARYGGTTSSDWTMFSGDTSNGDFALNLTGIAGTGGYVDNRDSTARHLTNMFINVGKVIYQPSPGGTFDATKTNANGATYVAYLFAHDTSTNGLIQCGSVTTDASGNATVSLGWEPQYVLLKYSSATSNWNIHDSMRGMPVGGADYYLTANLSVQELSYDEVDPTATGMNIKGLAANTTVIYLAIRRGPMRVPTDATKVFKSVVRTGTSADVVVDAGFTVDLNISHDRLNGNASVFLDRSRGSNSTLQGVNTGAEATSANTRLLDQQNGVKLIGTSSNLSPRSYLDHFFRRAPGFFDQVCYTGNEVAGRTINHNLTVVPEIIMIKNRTEIASWKVWHSALPYNNGLVLNSSNGIEGMAWLNNSAPTNASFTLGNAGGFAVESNKTGNSYVAYLFASCAGVSKIGSYTGSALDVTVACGFSGQPRFVLVKRTDTIGDWIVVDSARGTTVYLTLNTTNAETTATVITFTTGGFVAKAGTVANAASGANYIFMAIA